MENQNLTNEEKQELTALREEKRIRQQTQRAIARYRYENGACVLRESA